MARTITMEDGGQVQVLAMEEGMVEHLARGECVIGVLSDVTPPPLPSGCYLVEREDNVDMEFAKRVYARFCQVPWVIGEGERIILRELMLQDLSDLRKMERETLGNPSVESLLGLAEGEDEEGQKKRLESYIEGQYPFYEYGMWAVIEKETGSFLGICGFCDDPEETEDNEAKLILGYQILSSYQRQGYAKEACNLAITFMREWLQLDRVVCKIYVDNDASIAVAEALGMERRPSKNPLVLVYEKTWSEKNSQGETGLGGAVRNFLHWLTGWLR